MSSTMRSFSTSKRESSSAFGPAFRTRERQSMRSVSMVSGFSTKPKEPVVAVAVAASYTDFPSLKKAAPAAVAAVAAAKPVMNFKAVAAAAASKPAPIPTAGTAKKAAPRAYYDEWPDYGDEDVELEITDEDGGLNSRRAGDKSNW